MSSQTPTISSCHCEYQGRVCLIWFIYFPQPHATLHLRGCFFLWYCHDEDGGLDDRSTEEPRRRRWEFCAATCIYVTGYVSLKKKKERSGVLFQLGAELHFRPDKTWTMTATTKKLTTPTAWQRSEPHFFTRYFILLMVTNCTLVIRDCYIERESLLKKIVIFDVWVDIYLAYMI